MQNVIEVLRQRGLLEAVTNPDIEKVLSRPAVVYAGFDPSSDSLQVGNLIAVFGLSHFQRCGHTPIAVVGGATGMIGDPSGKSSERKALSADQVEKNLAGITENLSRFLDFKDAVAPARIVNNNDWMKKFSFVEFLRDVGVHFRLGAMLGKESVKARLESEAGMNYAEFSYQLLQSYDFLRLYDDQKCLVQIGGSDQWGNITAGIDLVRKLRGVETFGVTFPIVCDASGAKFGKSEGNAIYLDRRKTSCFNFYQFFMRTMDADVIRFLKMFTFLPMDEIAALDEQTSRDPGKRDAQKRLASELTMLVHGKDGLDSAVRATDALYGGSVQGLKAAELLDVFADVPSSELPVSEVVNRPAVDVAASSGLCVSKGEARRLLSGGGFYVNNVRISDAGALIRPEDVIDGRLLVLRSGKKSHRLIKVT